MRRAGISGLAPRKRGRITVRVPGVRVADDLVERRFRPARANVLCVADVTYLRSWEGWLYLAAVQDAFSPQIVGSMAEHMHPQLVVDELEMGLAGRRPDPGLVHHSDQGSQYVSLGFGQAARNAGVAISMGSKRDVYDNPVAESFFATLQEGARPPPRGQAAASFCNSKRRHRTLGMLSPADYEQTQTTAISITIKGDTT